jgi:hypothetical protein
MLLACPGVVSADYLVKSCNSQGCTTRVVRTPVRNVASWATPRRTASYQTYSAAPDTQVVRTYRTGLFGRRIYTGTRTVSTAPQASYGSSGSYQSYSQPVSYGSSGSYTTYRDVSPEPPSMTLDEVKSESKRLRTKLQADLDTLDALDERVEAVSGVQDCGCNGECGCPCCPCRPQATKPDEGKTLQIGKTLRIPKYQLAVKKLTVPTLRLAAR